MAAELARIRFAFVDLRLAQDSGVSRMTVAEEFVDSVDAVSVVAGRALAVVDVDLAVGSSEAGRTSAGVGPADDAGVADGPGVAGVGGAGVVQVAEQTSFAGRALAEVACNAVVAGAAVLAGSGMVNRRF